VIAFGDAHDPGWPGIRRGAHPDQQLPGDLLPGARSVVVWLLPFASGVAEGNAGGEWASRAWAAAYRAGNESNVELSRHLAARLAERGFRAATIAPTHQYDRLRLVAAWSHRHAARLCGLGSFGRHGLLITARGVAGRLCSLVTDAVLAPSPSPAPEACLERLGGSCDACLAACPVGALREDGFDREGCHRRCLANGARHPDLDAPAVCGKCVAACPATLAEPP
jgi:epoxyqueuosine reductase QueG